MQTRFFLGHVIGQSTGGHDYPGLWIYTMELVQELSGPEPKAIIEPVKADYAQEEPFPRLVDSRLFPGLIYDKFQAVVIYNGKVKKIPPTIHRTLYFFESMAGFADRSLYLESCWPEKGTRSAAWNAIYATNKFLSDLDISMVITCDKDVIAVE